VRSAEARNKPVEFIELIDAECLPFAIAPS
jgi:hypothetical protein